MMELSTLTTLSVINTAIAFLFFIFIAINKKRWRTPIGMVGILFGLSFGFDVLSHILYNNKINPNIASNSWIIVEYVLCSALYYSIIKNIRIRQLLIILSVAGFVFGVVNFLFWQGSSLNSYTRSIYCIIFSFYSIYYFFQVLEELPTGKIHHNPLFWINTGVLLYFSGTFVMNISINYLVNTLKSNLIFFWFFSFGLNFLRNILFGIGSWYQVKTAKGM